MAKFCRNCGRPLAEGEICTCTQKDEAVKKILRLLVPIRQTVAGGILVFFRVITGSFGWPYMSYVAGAVFCPLYRVSCTGQEIFSVSGHNTQQHNGHKEPIHLEEMKGQKDKMTIVQVI